MNEFRFTRPDNFPPIVKNLIIINVLMYVAQLTLSARFPFSEWVMLWPVMPEKLHRLLLEAGVLGSAREFRPYQLLTHMFAHSPQTLFHIVFNMFTLWMFGKVLENVWGGPRFLLFYFKKNSMTSVGLFSSSLMRILPVYVQIEKNIANYTHVA